MFFCIGLERVYLFWLPKKKKKTRKRGRGGGHHCVNNCCKVSWIRDGGSFIREFWVLFFFFSFYFLSSSSIGLTDSDAPTSSSG